MDITPSPYTGSMSLYGKGELTQTQVNATIDQHGIQYAGQPLQEVTIGSDFTSLATQHHLTACSMVKEHRYEPCDSTEVSSIILILPTLLNWLV
jgi:hypothetical protein